MDAVRTFFGAPGEIYFMGVGSESFAYRVREDGSGLEKAAPNPIRFFYDVAPDGKALAVYEGRMVMVYPSTGGSPTPICTRICGSAGGENRGITPPALSWSRNGKFIYLNVRTGNEIVALPVPPGRNLPPLPTSGITTVPDAEALPGARIIHEQRAYVGANPSVYAFARATSQRNIYRISVP